MIRASALFGLVPPWAWLLLAGAAVAGVAAWHLDAVSDGKAAGLAAGRAEVQGQWDAADLARERTANADRLRRAEQAIGASAGHETTRASIARALPEIRHAVQIALQAPVSCPREAVLEVGDVVLPAGAFDGLRRAAASGGGQRPD